MPTPTLDQLSSAELSRHLKERVATITNMIFDVTNGIVQEGPFTGQELIKETSWGVWGLSPKLLGTYEAELHDALEKAIRKLPDLVINVGCAEGYYAVGLAQRLPLAQIHAYDIEPLAQAVCKLAGLTNGVQDNLFVHGECTAETIKDIVASSPNALIVLDCEGAEVDLLPDDIIDVLRQSTLLIECHDFVNGQITDTLAQRLSPSHHIQILREGPRDPSAYKMLESLSTFDRWMAVCEFRPTLMHWLIATPKS